MPKNNQIKGAGFNTFAIIALFIILPFSVAQLTTLSAVPSSQPYDNLTDAQDAVGNYQSFPKNDIYGVTVNNVGDNATDAYIADSSNSINSFNPTDPYNCMWLVEEWSHDDPNRPYERTVCSFGYDTRYDNNATNRFFDFEGERRIKVGQTHSWLDYYGGTVPYIGYSGDKFSFSLHHSFFNDLQNQDLGKLRINMRDSNTGWIDINQAPRVNISFDYSIEFFYDSPNLIHPTNSQNLSSIKFDDFVYDGDNMECGIFDPYKWGVFTGCYTGLNMDFELTNFEVIELSEWLRTNGGDKSKISAIIDITNVENEDNGNGLGNVPLPWAGPSKFDMQVLVKYADPQQVNFILKGGTFILGVGLFYLAVASTPYYDPVRNYFKGAV